MKKFFLSVIGLMLMMSSLHAQVMSYTGSDEYIMSEFETIDIAKQRAQQKAIRNAQEQAGVYVQSNTEVVNMMVTKDEIRTMTAGILKVTDVHYQLTPLADGLSLIVKATVKADIDSNDLANYLNRPAGERADLVAKNLQLHLHSPPNYAKIAHRKEGNAMAWTQDPYRKYSYKVTLRRNEGDASTTRTVSGINIGSVNSQPPTGANINTLTISMNLLYNVSAATILSRALVSESAIVGE